MNKTVSDVSAEADDKRTLGSADVFVVAFRKSKKLVSVALIEAIVSPTNREDKFPL